MKILIIQTGGTIDKDYPKKNKGYAFEIDEPAAARILENAEPGFQYEINSLLKKDSLDISDKDRASIKAICEQTAYEKIVITHGSDTLVETARFIGDIAGKTILLTGAYRPERFSNSDAAFNLGVAIGALNMLEEGTFVAMNGKVMNPAACRKNPKTGLFESA
jgi:L-asparaginase